MDVLRIRLCDLCVFYESLQHASSVQYIRYA